MRIFLRLTLMCSVLSLAIFLTIFSSSAQSELSLRPPVDPGDGGECCVEPQDAPSLSGRVLVVYNANVPESLDVANYYMSRRGIPGGNLLDISPSNDTDISYSEFVNNVKSRIRNKLNALGNRNILYIVFSYRTPYRIPDVPFDTTGYGCAAPCNRGTSLDQFVADIWDQTSIWSPFNELQGGNVYYAQSRSKASQYQPFVSLAQFRNQSSSLTYSVWRLDAPSAALAKGLVDKAINAETNGLRGTAYFDKDVTGMYQHPDDTGGTLRGDWDIYRAAEFAREAGFTVVEDNHGEVFGTAPAPARADNAAMYAGTYNLGVYNDAFTWNTGAIGFDFNSSAAQNFRNGANWSGGALLKGITVTGGAIDEPYATLIFKFDGIFRNLFEGANVGDAVLRNTPALKWRLLNIGDPLYRPFPDMTLPRPTYSPNWTMIDLNAAPGTAAGITYPDGTMSNTGDNLAVRTFGNTLYGFNDSCNYLYKSLNGEGGIQTRVSRTEQVGSGDAFAGVMVRENTNPDGRFIALTITGTGLLQVYVRPEPGVFIGESNGFIRNIGTYIENPYPIWLRLERRGNIFYGYKSNNEGVTWTLVVTQTVNMSNSSLVGLVTVGHDNAVPNRAFYDGTEAYQTSCWQVYVYGQPPQTQCYSYSL